MNDFEMNNRNGIIMNSVYGSYGTGKPMGILNYLRLLDISVCTKSQGDKEVIHNEDGPAFEYPVGYFAYYLDDISYSKEEFELEIVKRKLEKIKSL